MNAYVIALGLLHAHRVLVVPTDVLRTLARLAYRTHVTRREIARLEEMP